MDLFDFDDDVLAMAAEVCSKLSAMSNDANIDAQNEIKRMLHAVSPMKDEPVDCVLWVPGSNVHANDYNPNSVAPPEMELLRVSIEADGYTQPIVSMPDDGLFEVVDGFHRHRVGRECDDIRNRVHGRLPIVAIKDSRMDKGDRMAATIRHNRARGKHKIDAMSDIVLDLKKRNWSDDKIARELGMEPDEVLRLAQITGLAEMFKDQDFSQAWEAELTEEVTIDLE
jgi:ParB-like chromosome segregation protein Spo0J